MRIMFMMGCFWASFNQVHNFSYFYDHNDGNLDGHYVDCKNNEHFEMDDGEDGGGGDGDGNGDGDDDVDDGGDDDNSCNCDDSYRDDIKLKLLRQ